MFHGFSYVYIYVYQRLSIMNHIKGWFPEFFLRFGRGSPSNTGCPGIGRIRPPRFGGAGDVARWAALPRVASCGRAPSLSARWTSRRPSLCLDRVSRSSDDFAWSLESREASYLEDMEMMDFYGCLVKMTSLRLLDSTTWSITISLTYSYYGFLWLD